MTDYFYDLLPTAIEIDMPLREFWEEDPNLFWAYRFSFYNKSKTKRDYDNQLAWLQGAYIYQAVSIALNNGFSDNKMDYPEEPFDLYKQKEEENVIDKQKQQQKILEERLKARAKKIEGMLGGKKDE